jgi:hypothetical protein
VTRGAPLALTLALAFGVACGGGGSGRAPASNPFTGTVVAVSLQGPTVSVRGGGATFAFRMADPLTTLSHLDQHRASGQPVVVTFETRDGALVATRVADAPGSSPASPS